MSGCSWGLNFHDCIHANSHWGLDNFGQFGFFQEHARTSKASRATMESAGPVHSTQLWRNLSPTVPMLQSYLLLRSHCTEIVSSSYKLEPEISKGQVSMCEALGSISHPETKSKQTEEENHVRPQIFSCRTWSQFLTPALWSLNQ